MSIFLALIFWLLSPAILLGVSVWAVWSWWTIKKHPELADRR